MSLSCFKPSLPSHYTQNKIQIPCNIAQVLVVQPCLVHHYYLLLFVDLDVLPFRSQNIGLDNVAPSEM